MRGPQGLNFKARRGRVAHGAVPAANDGDGTRATDTLPVVVVSAPWRVRSTGRRPRVGGPRGLVGLELLEPFHTSASGNYPHLMDEAGERREAVPGLSPDACLQRRPLLYTLDVEGESFEVRTHDGGTDYNWVSGPNKDYGFGTSARSMSEAEHRADIRHFLSMIEPATGFIAED